MKKLLTLFACLIALSMITALRPADTQAQAYSTQLTFLENFAVKLYERGEVDAAKKEFQRILKIEPANAAAKQYLEKIEQRRAAPAGSSQTAAEKANAIAGDIRSLKNDILQYENDLKSIESLVRTLITENDQLYMALNKRSREVMELREKVYGTRYADQYKEMMAELPLERIPQNLYRADDVLPALDTATAAAAPVALPEKGDAMTDTLPTGTTNEKTAAQLETLLSDKRDTLVDKNIALIEKRNQLIALKNRVSSMNQDLKSADQRYLALVDEIDKYYAGIKADLASKNYTDQKAFSDLMSAYNNKTRELEELKNSFAKRDAELAGYKTPLTAQDDKLKALDRSLAAKDHEMANLKAQLSTADQSASAVDSQVKTIQSLLKESDSDMADLSSGIDKIKTLIREHQALNLKKSKSIETLTAASSSRRSKEQSLEQKIASLEQRLKEARDMRSIKEQSQPPIPRPPAEPVREKAGTSRFEQEIALLKTSLSDKDRAISELKNHLNETEAKLSASELRINAKDENLLTLEERLNVKEDELRKLRGPSEVQPAATSPAIAAAPTEDEAKKLRHALVQQEKKTSEVNQALLARSKEVDELKAVVKDLQDKIVEATNARDAQLAQVARLSGMVDQQKVQVELNATDTQKNLQQTRSSLQARELDIKERELALGQAKTELTERASALVEAESQIKLLEEKLIALEAKQKAIRSVVDKRDNELAKVTFDLNKANDGRRAAQKEAATLAAKNQNNEQALDLANRQLRENGLRNAELTRQLEQLRKDLKTAQQIIKSRDKDVAELERLKDELAKRDGIIADLQEQVSNAKTSMSR